MASTSESYKAKKNAKFRQYNLYRKQHSSKQNRGGDRKRDAETRHNKKHTESINYEVINLSDNINDIGPYAGWKLYFPNDEYSKFSPIIKKVEAVEKLILNDTSFNQEDIEEKRFWIFDLKKHTEFLLLDWPMFKEDLTNDPVCTLNCLGLAAHQAIWNKIKEQSTTTTDEQLEVPVIRARIVNFNEITQLKNLKTNFYGMLVSVSGTVIRVGNNKLQCSRMAFKCNTCNTVQCVKQPDGLYTLPTSCSNIDCHCKTFDPIRSSPYTLTYDWQTIRLQELVPDDQREGGRVPRTVECELMDDLVGTSSPGDVVTLTGIVKVRSSEENKHKRSKAPSLFCLYIEAVSVTNNKNNSNDSVNFTPKDYEAIRAIHSEPFVFRLLVNSLCPMIYGHETVKAGLLLSLFGGASSSTSDVRSDIHVLVVGDPGLGKSQMLQACAQVAPRGVFVCGNTSTASGLTVTLTREGGNDYALEAGALVLADKGCCCIDEFDKMNSTQHESLLEVMEQQTVSVAKAGVICTLSARTSVLAAANPAGGHYNKGKTVAENLRIGQALLSRFDLVFILLDQPNEHLDSLLSEHVMALHATSSTVKQKGSSVYSGYSSQRYKQNPNKPLSEQLKLEKDENMDLLPITLLSKYIAYARKYVAQPKLSRNAALVLERFYHQLRTNYHTRDSTPVTTRQLFSLIRLTQARAKLELREEATEQDAKDVVELMRHSMLDTYSNEFGVLDFTRSQNGSGLSSKNQAKRFLTVLHKQSQLLTRSVFSSEEMKTMAKNAGIDLTNFSSFISNLNTQGFLLKRANGYYQLLSAD